MDFPKERFSEWFDEVLEKAGILDKRYPIKGMNVWLPYGWGIMRNIDNLFREVFTRHGHKEVYFPLLIPEDQFRKEAEHIKGFGGEVYWVTHGGMEELDVKLVLRPTSETAMYPMFALWIRSHADLPFRIFQIVDVFRYETKMTRPLLRVRQIHFFEAHTAHEDYEDAERQIEEDIEIWKEIARKLALPYVLNRRPEWDKFAGAEYSIAADTIMPNGRALQVATMHEYGKNFSVPYEIKYLKEDGTHEHVCQTTFGMSERLVGAIIGVHGDERGMKLPPEIAPIQVVVVPIPSKKKEEVMREAKVIEEELSAAGIRAHADLRDKYTPGYKFYDWELRGVPLRVEIGPRDMEKGGVVLVRRDTGEKEFVERDVYIERIRALLSEIQEAMLRSAEEEMRSKILVTDDIAALREHAGWGKVHWCGRQECAERIKEETEKQVLGTPIGEMGTKGRCIICGEETEIQAYVAKTY